MKPEPLGSFPHAHERQEAKAKLPKSRGFPIMVGQRFRSIMIYRCDFEFSRNLDKPKRWEVLNPVRHLETIAPPKKFQHRPGELLPLYFNRIDQYTDSTKDRLSRRGLRCENTASFLHSSPQYFNRPGLVGSSCTRRLQRHRPGSFDRRSL